MFPTITARVTFQDFKSCNSIPSSMFFIPRDYKVSQVYAIKGLFSWEGVSQIDCSFERSSNLSCAKKIALHANRTLF